MHIYIYLSISIYMYIYIYAPHLWPAELQVGLVDGGAEQLVERHVAGEDDRRVALLNHALAEPQHVGADADVARGAVGEREDLSVGDGRLCRDGARALQRLDAEPVLGADDGGDLVVVAHRRLLGLVLVLILGAMRGAHQDEIWYIYGILRNYLAYVVDIVDKPANWRLLVLVLGGHVKLRLLLPLLPLLLPLRHCYYDHYYDFYDCYFCYCHCHC